MAEQIIVPRRRQDWFKDNGDLTLRALRFFESLTDTTNTNTDDLTGIDNKIVSSASRISKNAASIGSIDLKEFEIISTTTSLTTNRNQIILCNNSASIDITLDPLAIKGDEVHIKRQNAEVIEKGTIEGLTDRTINVLNWSDHLVFDGTDWSVI